MIEVDKEIKLELESLYRQINSINKDTKLKKILSKFIYLIGLVIYLFFLKGCCFYIKNTIIIVIIAFGSFLMFLLWVESYYNYLKKDIKNLSEQINTLKNEVQNTKNFSDYLIAYRQIEAKNNNVMIYPELRYQDSEYVIQKYKNMYEKKRIEYEKNHISRLKLNKYYLDEKLRNAPIESYPIQEQELLRERQKEMISKT